MLEAFEPFELGDTLLGHEQDVKSVTCISDKLIASGSRDTSVIVWSRDDPGGPFHIRCKFNNHEKYVNAVTFVRGCDANNPAGFLVSSGSDSLILVHSLDKLNEPALEPTALLLGHESNVCFLSGRGINDQSNTVLSGSWDKTARVWVDWQCLYTLRGHSAAVWCVLASPNDGDTFFTGSGDATIKRWKRDKCVSTLGGHTDCVRGLVSLGNENGFASCANDAVLKLWTWSGECLASINGHSSFVYSLAYCPASDLIYSSGEDRTVCVYSRSSQTLVQRIPQPCTSLWTVAAMPNGDLVVGGSDSNVRIFTRDKGRMADVQSREKYKELVASQAISKGALADKVNREALPGKEALEQPGEREGQLIMIKGDSATAVVAYQWSSHGKCWICVGDVVDAVGHDKRQVYEGKEYDYVFEVDLGDGVMLKLAHNAADNPYVTAQNFITKHELGQDFLDQIAKFIIQNTTNSGTLGSVSSSGASGALYQPSLLPPAAYLKFTAGNTAVIYEKLKEYALEEGSSLAQTNFAPQGPSSVDFKLVEALLDAIDEWPRKKLLPVFDTLRLLVVRDPSLLLHNWQSRSVLLRLTAWVSDAADSRAVEDSKLIMLVLRALVNAYSPGTNDLNSDLSRLGHEFILWGVQLLKHWTFPQHANELNALVSLYLNSAILAHETRQLELAVGLSLLDLLLEVLTKLNLDSSVSKATASELYARVAAAIGVLVLANRSLSKTGLTDEMRRNLQQPLSDPSFPHKLLFEETLQLL